MGKKLITALAIVILLIPAGFVIYTLFGDMFFEGKTLTREERLEQRKQENRTLLEIALSGTDKNIQ